MSQENDKKEIEVINGDGSNLLISPVYDHIKDVKTKSKYTNQKSIVIPDEKKEDKKSDND